MIVDPAQTTRADVYRLVIRCIVPRPIAWVSTQDAGGIANLAPFSFFTGVASAPPSVLFCPGRRGEAGDKKDTLRNVEETGEFVVSLVTEELAGRMNETATDYPPEVDEFAVTGLTPARSLVVGPPRVAESPVSFECRRLDVFHVGAEGAGGAAIVVGEIVMIHVDDRVLRDGKVDPERLRPVARLGGMEYTRLGERFTLVRKKYGA
jgi:flavin reductase (DIM6/NTAB) family NADH-FMN oxidoreductase RutF